jgi:hypothetical protein
MPAAGIVLGAMRRAWQKALPQHNPRPQNPKQPPTGAEAGAELNSDDLMEHENA